MKDIEYYKGADLPHVKKSDFEVLYVTQKGKLVYEGPPSMFDPVKLNAINSTRETTFDRDGFHKAVTERSAKIRARTDEFKSDLLEANGVTAHPKAERAYAIAHERSDTFEECIDYFEDLCELLTWEMT